ncbi:hypothetical protein FJV41_03620 [Myxococcus llanfairpwllgwyngyllgogerychwyrndrobwllllantysiliogogogochensis]|uniref:Lipoprotein n=2 Tax=Myxococcus llanfairpwllgwyngyllgogerychwyrndrobwllllantysiliogogogochensis TaxID=2590453 RepID=A0A540X7W5_9BACT|nr:hypothetical protein FJV41_03620 [Myxococcus llanfairpwllgwyngyllgogerychwyrndrobwllllantysiliogogogochensis]
MWSWVAVAVMSLSSVSLGAQGDEVKGDGDEQGRTIRFTKKDAVVGESEEQRLRMEMTQEFSVTAPEMEPESISLKSAMVQNQVLTTLAAKGRIVTQRKIAYGEVQDVTKDGNGKETREVAAVSGKSYLGEFKKGRIAVTDLDGMAVTKQVREMVVSDLEGLGEEDPIVAAFPEAPLKIGDSVERVAKAFQDSLQKGGGGDGVVFKDTRIQLSEIRHEARGPVGVFTVSTTLEVPADEESPVAMSVTYQGTMNILAAGIVLTSFSMAGPLKLTPTPELFELGMRVTGKGDSRLVLTTRVLPPPPKK